MIEVSVRANGVFPKLQNIGDVSGHLGKDPLALFFYPKANTAG